MRTTLDIEEPVLEELRRLQNKDGRSMGEIVSSLLSESLKRKADKNVRGRFVWKSAPMMSRVDLSDKDAVYRILDGK